MYCNRCETKMRKLKNQPWTANREVAYVPDLGWIKVHEQFSYWRCPKCKACGATKKGQ